MRKKSLMLAAVLAAGVMMAACGSASTLPDNSQEKPVASQQTESKYSFELKGIELKTDGDLTEYTSKLGEPSGGYYEAKSCAFEGMDKFYYYDSVTLQGYQKDGNDKLYSITLMDDAVKTKEGVRIGDKKDKATPTVFVPSYSRGVATARDTWCYNSSKEALVKNIKKTLDFHQYSTS